MDMDFEVNMNEYLPLRDVVFNTLRKAILRGEEKGSKRQAVCLNAGAALYIAGKAETMEVGVRMAEELIDSGAALKKLDEFIACSNE